MYTYIIAIIWIILLVIWDIAKQNEKQNNDETRKGIRRGFPHIQQIDRSIYLLYKHIPLSFLNEYQNKNLSLPMPDQLHDPVIDVQNVARMLAQYYNFSVGTIVVTFRSDISIHGRVELSSSHDFFIELHQKHAERPKEIIAILAHEITHIFLYKHNISFSDENENEILTDTAAAYLGLGSYILDASIEEIKRLDAYTLQTTYQHFGYLTPDEFEYILAKRAKAFQEDPTKMLSSSLARSAWLSGLKRLNYKWQTPPLSMNSWLNVLQKIRYTHRKNNARKKQLISQDSNPVIQQYEEYYFERSDHFCVVFYCPICSQKLRIPVIEKELSVRCSLCQIVFKCQP